MVDFDGCDLGATGFSSLQVGFGHARGASREIACVGLRLPLAASISNKSRLFASDPPQVPQITANPDRHYPPVGLPALIPPLFREHNPNSSNPLCVYIGLEVHGACLVCYVGPCPQTQAVTTILKTVLVAVKYHFHHPLLVGGYCMPVSLSSPFTCMVRVLVRFSTGLFGASRAESVRRIVD